MRRFSRQIVAMILVTILAVSGCSKKLDKETVPVTEPTTVATETTAEPTTEATTEATEATTEETEPSETEPKHGPFSTAVVTERVVDVNGQLRVEGSKLVNENGEVIQLKGMSSFGLCSMFNFVNKDTVQTLAEDWGCSVFRLAMYTKADSDGYIINPDKYFNQVCEYVDLCVDQGIYVIIDWHILYDGNPQTYKAEAIDFFSRISAIYADCPNVLYEICNEPNSRDEEVDVTWDDVVRPYAEEVIAAIRANDPDNIIIVGTPTWSQDVDIASLNPLPDDNIMYTLHFYAGSHKQDHRDKVQVALDNGLPIFCTEWGTTPDSGAGVVNIEESKIWLDFLDANDISWCNWSIGGSAVESSNALHYVSKILTIEEKLAGHWPDEFISESGLFVRAMILGQEYVPAE